MTSLPIYSHIILSMVNIIANSKATLTKLSLKYSVLMGGIYATLVPAMAQDAFQQSSSFGGDQFGTGGATGLNVNRNSLVVQITNITNAVFILLGFVATLFIIISGIQLVVSRGNEDAMKKAKQTIIYAVMGFALILVSWGVVRLIVSLLLAGSSGPSTNAPFQQEYTPAANQ